MSSGTEQEYVVYKNKKKRSRRNRSVVVTPLVVQEAPSTPSDSSISSVEKEDSDVISNIIRMRWHNDMISIQNTRKMFGLPANGRLEPQSPVKFFENSKTARMFQIAQQYPSEYIPVPVMQPYMVPLYPNKEFYDGHGFIPSQFLV